MPLISRSPIRLSAVALALVAAGAIPAQALDTSVGSLTAQPVITGLDGPWSLAFLPGGAFLVTEIDGRLLLIRDGTARPVDGLPEILVDGQGGLLDVMVPRDFAETGEVFLTHAASLGRSEGTVLTRAVLDLDGARLTGVTRIFEMVTDSTGGRHFGSRVVEGPQGHLFMTLGERGDRPAAQDLSRHNGTVIRLNRSSSVGATASDSMLKARRANREATRASTPDLFSTFTTSVWYRYSGAETFIGVDPAGTVARPARSWRLRTEPWGKPSPRRPPGSR